MGRLEGPARSRFKNRAKKAPGKKKPKKVLPGAGGSMRKAKANRNARKKRKSLADSMMESAQRKNRLGI